AGGVSDELARLTGDLAVDQDLRAGGIPVPVVTGSVLEIPVHLSAVGVPGDHAVGEQIVAGPIGRIEHRHRIAGAPDHLVGRDIVAAGHPHGAAAGLPGVVLVLPGLAAGLARSRDRVLLPDELAGLGIESGDPVAHAAVAAGGADDDLILDGERRSSELEIGLTVAHVRLPDDLASILIGRDDAWRI